MNIFESVTSAFASVFANKMRSVLTMLGIIIGISSVIMITSIGQGFQSSVNDQFAKLGAVGLQVSVKYDTETKSSDLLTLDDERVFLSHPQVDLAVPLIQASGQVKLKNPAQTSRVYMAGTSEKYTFVQSMDMRYGRFLAKQDTDSKSPVAVIDTNLALKIFGRSNAVGQTITCSMWFGNIDLTVIGVYKSDDFGTAMFEMPSVVYMPVTTVMQVSNSDTVDSYFVNVKDRATIDTTAQELAKMLALAHHNTNKYNVQNLLKQMDTINSVLGNITAFVGLVAAISLVVGGIGVMNIMLVTVTERTREIGIRKSLGATNGNIQFQFLIEAIILTAIGGLIGILLGYFGGFALGNAIGINASVDFMTVLGTVLISMAIGIIFGVYPARKAARLDPIEALRYE